jgi:hypothetical protein
LDTAFGITQGIGGISFAKIGSRTIGEEDMIARIKLNGFGVGSNSLVILPLLEVSISLILKLQMDGEGEGEGGRGGEGPQQRTSIEKLLEDSKTSRSPRHHHTSRRPLTSLLFFCCLLLGCPAPFPHLASTSLPLPTMPAGRKRKGRGSLTR